jgi:hypothetical protein
MLVKKNAYGYSQKKKYVTGRGFVDSLSNVFNSIKASAAPTLKSIGSYVSNNKDLIVKPLLGAVGSLAATGLTAGVPALVSHIMNKNRKKVTVDDPKYKEILQSITQPPPVTNIIGNGAALARVAAMGAPLDARLRRPTPTRPLDAGRTGGEIKRRGAGIKQF